MFFGSIVRYPYSYQNLDHLKKLWLLPSESVKGNVLSLGVLMNSNSDAAYSEKFVIKTNIHT